MDNGSDNEGDTPVTISAEDLSRHSARMERFEGAVTDARKMNLSMRYMHSSVLSATTRKSHADRHGKLFTAEEVRTFWSNPENVAGCRCMILAVMVGQDNQPLVPAFAESARKLYEKMAARGYEWSK